MTKGASYLFKVNVARHPECNSLGNSPKFYKTNGIYIYFASFTLTWEISVSSVGHLRVLLNHTS